MLKCDDDDMLCYVHIHILGGLKPSPEQPEREIAITFDNFSCESCSNVKLNCENL